MNEDKAIRLCLKHRDPNGFEFLVVQYRREAFFHAYALLRNEADAADACQDAFSQAFAAMPGLRSLDQFYPWFYRILRNRCLNLIDRKKTREDYANHEKKSKEASLDTRTPACILSAKEHHKQVWDTLCELGKDHRVILTLKYVNGFSYEEISKTLGIARGTVMSRLYAARQAFRKRFDPED
jgi:RNA polymerase sigma-70 factor (ECF subfamily)